MATARFLVGDPSTPLTLRSGRLLEMTLMRSFDTPRVFHIMVAVYSDDMTRARGFELLDPCTLAADPNFRIPAQRVLRFDI